MASAREYNLTLEAIFHAVHALPGDLPEEAGLVWRIHGGRLLAPWADLLPVLHADIMDPAGVDMCETLRDLCIAFNTMIEEDTNNANQ